MKEGILMEKRNMRNFRKQTKRFAAGAMAALVAGTALTAVPYNVLADEVIAEWREENGVKYWYENGVRQGVKYREDGSIDASYRGKEIYDPSSNAWYWLDCVQNGAVAKDKDVYQESQADDAGNIGKWVRYDADGHMVKGWSEKDGDRYYFDPVYGTMAKGDTDIDGIHYYFNKDTGILESCGQTDDDGRSFNEDGWHKVDGVNYWYENGVRQGVKYREDGSIDASYRGKEIYDPSSNAWYWLDCVQNGAVAKDKDVYQESQADDAGNIGKWVRYDADGHMIKGWNEKDGSKYYFDPVYGTMAKGAVTIDGKKYEFDDATGKLVKEVVDDNAGKEDNKDDEKKQVALSDCTVILTQDSYESDGTEKKPEVTVKNGDEVIASTEYTVSYSDNINVGTATVTVTANVGSKVISGSVKKTYTIIEQKNNIEWSISEDGKLTVTGHCDGKLYSYDSNFNVVYPWEEYKNKIKSVCINVTGLKSMYKMFKDCVKLEQIDLNNLDTSKVDSMNSMFSGCSRLNSIDLSGLDTGNVTDMNSMFSGCSRLEKVDLSGLDTRKVTDMNRMFYECGSLSSLDLSELNTENVTSMYNMFGKCIRLSSLDLSGFNTENVKDMSGMFLDCSSLKKLDLSGFDTSGVTEMDFMFSGCSGLNSLNFSGLDTGKVTDMKWMFYECNSLSNLDLSGFDTENVKYMSGMFARCSSLSRLDLSEFNTEIATDMTFMFSMCTNLKEITVGQGWDTSIADTSSMFASCGTDHVTVK